MRPAAMAAPQHCLHFYTLCSETVQTLTTTLHDDGINLAFTLLSEESAALVVLCEKPPATSGADETLLLGQLTLLSRLWEVLTEHDAAQASSRLIESNSASRLHLLLNEFLFPEAKVSASSDPSSSCQYVHMY